MKILVVASTFPRWARDTDPTFVYELGRRLVDDDTEVHVLAPHTAGARTEETMDGLHVHRFRYAPERLELLAYGSGMLDKVRGNPLYYLLVPVYLVAMAVAVRRLVARGGFTVVHAHWLVPQGVACAAALESARDAPPLVCTSHGGDLFGLRGSLPVALKRWTVRRCRAVTVVSRYMREFLLSELDRDADPLVMSMGVDLETRFVPVPGVQRDEASIVFVGRLVEKKGVTYLLKAFSIASRELPDVRLTIVGDGPERPALEAEAAALGIGDRVRFAGALAQDAPPGNLFRRGLRRRTVRRHGLGRPGGARPRDRRGARLRLRGHRVGSSRDPRRDHAGRERHPRRAGRSGRARRGDRRARGRPGPVTAPAGRRASVRGGSLRLGGDGRGLPRRTGVRSGIADNESAGKHRETVDESVQESTKTALICARPNATGRTTDFR